MRMYVLTLAFVAASANAQSADDEWRLEDGYQTQLLYLHALVNYAFDGEWQFDWQRRQFADNALRINTGSVSSDQLLTDVELNINADLNDDWRFFGRFTREGFRRRPVREDQLLLGLEWLTFDSSGFYVGINPEFNKEFIDLAAGYTFYAKGREQYVRVGVLAEDFNWTSKNRQGGTQSQRPVSLEWSIRWPIKNDWWIYSAGNLGSGYDRSFQGEALSPALAAEERRDDEAELRVSRHVDDKFWSVSVEHFEFRETAVFRSSESDYDYSNRQTNIGVEHVRLISDRHRWRILAQWVDQRATSVGFRAHKYRRQDFLGGVFYDRLYRKAGWSVAYAFGFPDIDYEALGGQPGFSSDDYTDKLIVGWRYDFSANALIRITVSQEVSERGFGGGAIQYQMFF